MTDIRRIGESNKLARVVLIGLLLTVALPIGGRAIEPTTSGNYVNALSTADAFLWAWVKGNTQTGHKLISHGLASKIQKAGNESWFELYMTGLSDPHHHSFEISWGKQINPSRFSFPVTLYEYYSGEPKAFKYASKIEIIQEGNLWRVDLLPRSSDNNE